MVVVTANWLFSDGSIVEATDQATVQATVQAKVQGRVDRFIDSVRGIAGRAGMRGDGTYAPLERLDVVLAGDTFDWLVSDRWLGRDKPWHGGRIIDETAGGLARASVEAAGPMLASLRRLALAGVTVPAADRRGRPSRERAAIVPVVVTLLPGDRDAALAFEWSRVIGAWPELAVGSCWERTGPDAAGVVVRHGHEFDPLCVGGEPADGPLARRDRPPTLSESLLVDLVAAFAVRLRDVPHAAHHARRLVRLLVRSQLVDLPQHVSRAAPDAGGHVPATAHALLDLWKRSVDHWHRAARTDPPASPTGFDAVDALATWMIAIPPASTSSARAARRCAEGWLETDRGDLARRSSDPNAPRLVLGHPAADLSGRSLSGVVTLGTRRLSPGERPPRVVHEVAVAPSGGEDDPAWVAIPTGRWSPLATSPGMWRDAA